MTKLEAHISTVVLLSLVIGGLFGFCWLIVKFPEYTMGGVLAILVIGGLAAWYHDVYKFFMLTPADNDDE